MITDRWPDARPTRFKGLGYLKTAPGCWRVVDVEQTKYNADSMNAPSCTGPVYRTKAELLADLHRFATEYGAEPR